MKLEWLEAFVAFAEHLSFTHAARALHVSQPALHVQIARLADALGAPLYQRQGRALVLTAEGRETLRIAREMRERAAELRDVVRTGASAQPVALAAGEGAYLYLLGDAIRAYTSHGDGRRAPLRLLTRDAPGVIAAVESGEAHVGVVGLPGAPAGLDAALVAEVPMMLAMPARHPLARKKRIAITDLADARLIVGQQGRPLRAAIDAAFLSAGVPWHVAVEAAGWPLMLQFVRLGVGLAVVNACCALPPGVVARPLPALPPARYWLVRRSRSSVADELVRTIRERIWRP